jgi:hypothetical protein
VSRTGATHTAGSSFGDFTVDWFTNNIPTWRSLLVPRLSGRPCRVLEVGSYEGRSARWLLQNALTHPRSSITCVDAFRVADRVCWKGRPVASGGGRDVLRRFLRNTAEFGNRVRLVREPASTALRREEDAGQTYDMVYLDSDGAAKDCLEQAVLAWPLVKPGGVLVFDDYTHSALHDGACPRRGVDAFLDCYASEFRALHVGWQVIVERRKAPLPLPRCYSELSDPPAPGKLC